MRRSALGRSRGFTVVELLAVVGIIVVLVGILLPALNKARQQANTIKCHSNIRQIYCAIAMYVQETRGGVLPIPPTLGERAPFFAVQMKAPGWYNFSVGTIWPEVATGVTARQRVFNCPSEGSERIAGTRLGAADPAHSRNFSYNFNFYMRGNMSGQISIGGTRYPGWTGVKMSRVIHPERKLLILEQELPVEAAALTGVGNPLPPPAPQSINLLTTRHQGMPNVGFADGHVERFDPALLRSGDIRTYVYLASDVRSDP